MMLSFFFIIPIVLVALPSATLKQIIKMMVGGGLPLQFSALFADVGYQPKWYVGSGIIAFNAAAFSTSIQNNLSSAISSATSAPGSSSGFSSSGSSGGGGW